ncbi:MAG: ATP-binding protein, partial [Bacteroidales bacterium]|nr:ATP-binding protein [Bacteroidales bacterium]
FRVKNENEFYEQLLSEIIKASSSKWEEWIKSAKSLLKGLVSSFSVGVDPYQDFKFKLNWEDPEMLQNAVLELPERIAIKKKIKFVICIDEFQKIDDFSDSLQIQQKLRSNWQSHQNCSYCLYGSKYHIINKLFSNESMPFFRFGDIIYLDKIPEKHWRKFIAKGFNSVNKTIDKKYIEYIINLSNNLPFHVQQLSHQVWRLTEDIVDDKVFQLAIDELLKYNNILYGRMIDDLSELQINLLKAISEGESKLNSKSVIQKYNLGTSGNVETIKKALMKKEIISFTGKSPEFEDPLFAYWFRNDYC